MNTTTVTLASLNARDATIELVDDNKNVYRASVRPEVAKFAIEMETVLREKLRENDHKHRWDEMDMQELVRRIRDEVRELKHAYYDYVYDSITSAQRNHRHESFQHLRHEAIDIANFCMFLCNNYPETEADL